MEFVDGADETATGSLENIWTASSDGDLARVQDILSEGISINAQDDAGYSPMHAAASYGQKPLIEFLLSHGADIHIRDADGDTPLLVCEEPEIFELLLSVGACPDDRNSSGQDIFAKAVDDENETMIRYLIEKGYVSEEVGTAALSRLEQGDDDGEYADMEEDDGDDDEDITDGGTGEIP